MAGMTPAEVKSALAFAYVSRGLHVVALMCVFCWVTGENSAGKYLGGLDLDAHLFNWHPLLMVFGFVVCLGEGALAFRTHGLGKPRNKKAHAAWMSMGLLSAALGLRAVFKQHNMGNAANLYTAHGLVGLLVFALFAAQWLGGFVGFLMQWVGPEYRAALLPWHVRLGVALYLAAAAAVVSGVAEKQAWMGCNYYEGGDATHAKVQLRSPDYNPMAHTMLIPAGCRLGLGVSVATVAATLITIVGALRVMPQKPAKPEDGLGAYQQVEMREKGPSSQTLKL